MIGRRDVTASGSAAVAIGGDAKGPISTTNIAPGRDVVAQLLVTGDRNSFFIGGYQRINDAYINPWSVFERVNIERFTGREWLQHKMDRFFQEKDRGYFIIEAKAGMGKSAFLAHLVKECAWIHHFVELAPGETGIVPARKNLAAQVMRAYELADEQQAGVIPDDAASRPDFLANLLRAAAGKRQEGERLVVAIDGLNEAGTYPGENVLGLPPVLPLGVFFVVSRQPGSGPLAVDCPTQIVTIDSASAENGDDVRAYLRQATHWEGIACALRESRNSRGRRFTAEEFVNVAFAKSGGVWIYLHYVISEIEEQHRRQGVLHKSLDLDALPQGLWAYYANFWRNWKGENRSEWHSLYLRILAALAAARESVTLELLCDLAGVGQVPELPERWRPFLIRTESEESEESEEPRYRLYHESLQRFLHGRDGRDELGEDDRYLADELARATRQAHRGIATHYINAWGGLDNGLPDLDEGQIYDLEGRYGPRHITEHLVHARMSVELFTLARNSRFEAFQREHLRDQPGAGIMTAEAALLSAIDSGDPSAMTEFALLKANRISSIRRNLSPLTLLRAASIEAAWAAADLYEPERRVLWHLLIIWELQEGGAKSKAHATIARLSEKPLAKVDRFHFRPILLPVWDVDVFGFRDIQNQLLTHDSLAWLAEQLAHRGDLEEAARLLQELPDIPARGSAFTKLASAQMEAGDLTAAKETAHGITDQSECSRALAGIAWKLAGENDRAGVKLTLNEITTPESRAPVLALLAALDAESGHKMAAREGYAAAHQVAVGIADETDRADALAEIALIRALTDDTQAAQDGFAAAVKVAQSIEIEFLHDVAVMAVAERQAQARDFRAALATSRSISDSRERPAVLAAIAVYQARAGQTEAAHATFDMALEAAHKIADLELQAPKIAAIGAQQARMGEGKWARATFTHATDIATAIADETERAEAFAKIAMHQAGAGEEEAARKSYAEALKSPLQGQIKTSADQLTVELDKLSYLIYINDQLSEMAKTYATTGNDTAALATTRRIRLEQTRAEALATIANVQARNGRLAAARTTCRAGLEAAREVKNDIARAHIIARIGAEQLRAEDKAAAQASFAEALATVQTAAEDPESADVLTAMASVHALAGDVTNAEHILQQIGDGRARVNALVGIAAAHIEAGAIDAVQSALTASVTAAAQIHHEAERAKALVAIAGEQVRSGDTAVARATITVARKSKERFTGRGQAEFLKSIAKVYAEIGDVTCVRESADQIQDEQARANAFAEAIETFAASGRGDLAADLAESLTVYSSRAAKAIAQALSKAHDIKHFKQLLNLCAEPDNIHRIPQWLAWLYPNQALQIAAIAEEFGQEVIMPISVKSKELGEDL